MGIRKELFLNDGFDIFICPVCEEVALDPVVASCCESVFCSTCFNDTIKCKACHKSFSQSIKSSPFQKQLDFIYQRLKLRCEDCDEEMTIKDKVDHDCPAKLFDCIKCGFCDHIPRGESHDCIVWLKAEHRRLKDDNQELKRLCEQFVKIYTSEKDSSGLNVSNSNHRNASNSNGLNKSNLSDRNVSTSSGLNVSNEVQFNEVETFASKRLQHAVSDAVIQMVDSGYKIYDKDHCKHFRSIIRSDGQWCLVTRDNPGSKEQVPSSGLHFVINNMMFEPRTFCSFSFHGYRYIAFRRIKTREDGSPEIELDQESLLLMEKIRHFAQEQEHGAVGGSIKSGGIKSGIKSDGIKSGIKVSSIIEGVVFVESETFASAGIRGKVSAVISQAASADGSLPNFTIVRYLLKNVLPGQWFIYLRASLDWLLRNYQGRGIIPNTFSSFTLGEHHYIAFKHRNEPPKDEESIMLMERIRRFKKIRSPSGGQSAPYGEVISDLDSGLNVSNPVVFNENETFASKDAGMKVRLQRSRKF